MLLLNIIILPQIRIPTTTMITIIILITIIIRYLIQDITITGYTYN